jgi:hypothetical protein
VAPGFRLAIECDGDSYHGPDKLSDDVRRQRDLERLGWDFWRIRASQYYLDPEASMQPLWSRLEDLKQRAHSSDLIQSTPVEVDNGNTYARLGSSGGSGNSENRQPNSFQSVHDDRAEGMDAERGFSESMATRTEHRGRHVRAASGD